MHKYLDINKTEFTVRKRPVIYNRTESEYDNFVDEDTYDIKPLDGRYLYDKYRNLSNDAAPTISGLSGSNSGSTMGLLAAQHVSNYTSQASLDQVTSFTVDRTQMRKNFQHANVKGYQAGWPHLISLSHSSSIITQSVHCLYALTTSHL